MAKKEKQVSSSSETVPNYATDPAAFRRKKALVKQRIVSFIPLMAMVVLGLLYIICALANGFNLRLGFRSIISQATLVALVATGATFIFTAGSFDLSLGSNMLVSALLGGLVGKATGNLFLMLIVSIAVAIALSVLNSSLASVFKLPVFIMTIVMMSVYSAVATLILTTLGQNAQVAVPMELVEPLNNSWFRLILLGVYELFCLFIFYILKLGRKQKFLGGNSFVAYLSGIKASKLTILSFALAGIGIGLAAFSMTVETPTLSASSGSSVGMNMLIVLVFGGMSMSGGPKSKMYAAIVGAFSMAFLDAFMNIYVEGSWYLQIVKGILFVTVVFAINSGTKHRLLER